MDEKSKTKRRFSIKRLIATGLAVLTAFSALIMSTPVNAAYYVAPESTSQWPSSVQLKGYDPDYMNNIIMYQNNAGTPPYSEIFNWMAAGRLQSGDQSTVLYCLDQGYIGGKGNGTVFPRESWETVLWDKDGLAKALYYVSRNAYPAVIPGGMTAEEAEFATQIVVWKLTNHYGLNRPANGNDTPSNVFDWDSHHFYRVGSPNTPNNTFNNWINQMYTAAKNNVNTIKTGNISLSSNTGQWVRGADGKLHTTVTVHGDFDTWKIVNKAHLDSLGVTLNAYQGTPGFLLKVTLEDPTKMNRSMDIQFSAETANAPQNIGWYNPSFDNTEGKMAQSYVAFPKSKQNYTTDIANFNVPVSTGTLRVRKQNPEGGYIPDTEFQVFDKDDNIVKVRYVTDTDGANVYTYDPTSNLQSIKTGRSGRASLGGLEPGNDYRVVEVSVAPPYLLDSPSQDFDIVESQTTGVNFVNNQVYGNISIHKSDAMTEAALSGAKFRIRLDALSYPAAYSEWVNKVGSYVADQLTTSEDGSVVAIDPLPLGRYTVEETTAPENYYFSSTDETATGSIQVELTYKDNETSIVVADANLVNKLQRGNVVIQKTDIINGDTPTGDGTLQGATYSLVYVDYPSNVQDESAFTFEGEVVEPGKVIKTDVVTSANGRVQLNDLPLGTYDLIETIASENYAINNVAVRFEMQYDGTSGEYTPKRIQTSYNSESSLSDLNAAIDRINARSKEMGGTRVVDYYTAFDISEANPNGNTIFTFERPEMAYLEINKVIEEDENGWKDSNLPEDGLTFNILQNNVVVDTIQTTQTGFGISKLLPLGIYTLVEVNAPEGVKPMDPLSFTLDEDGICKTLDLVNEWIETTLKIVKKDADTGEVIPMAGVTFELYDVAVSGNPLTMNGSTVFETNENGECTFPKLIKGYGTYYLQEVKAPLGYYLDPDGERIQVDIDGQSTVIEALMKVVEVENVPQKGQIELNKLGDILTGWNEKIVDDQFNELLLTGRLQASLPLTADVPKTSESETPVKPEEPDVPDETSPSTETTTTTETEVVETEKNETTSTSKTESTETNSTTESTSKQTTVPEKTEAPEVTETTTTQAPTETVTEETIVEGRSIVEETKIPSDVVPSEHIVPESVDPNEDVEPVLVANLFLFGASAQPLSAKRKVELETIDVTYALLNPSGKVLKTMAGGLVDIEDLPVGTYTIVETNVPDGYKNYKDGLKISVKPSTQPASKTYTVHEPIWKQDYLPGATFNVVAAEDIYSKSSTLVGDKWEPILLIAKGTVVDTLHTNDTGVVISKELPLGTYTLVETNVPMGYLKANDITITLSETEQTVRVTSVSARIINERQDYEIQFVKEFEQSEWFQHHEIAPSETLFGIYNVKAITRHGVTLPANSLMGLTRLDDELKGTFNVGFAGEYIVKELHTNEAYNLAKDVEVNAEYNADGLPTESTIVAKPIVNELKKGALTLVKIDVESNETLAGAEYRLYAVNGDDKFDLGLFKTNDKGELKIDNLEFGTYYLEEVTAPKGYYLDSRPIDVFINGIVDLLLQLTNRKTTTEINKVDIGGKEVKDAHMQVIDKVTGEVIDAWISGDFAHVIRGLETDRTYVLIEDLQPAGYMKANSIEFTVNSDGSVTPIEMINELNKVTITKKDLTSGDPLPGATIEIFDSEGKVVFKAVSDENGEVNAFGLAPGKYTFKETAPPAGWQINPETFDFEIDEDGFPTAMDHTIFDKPTEVTIKKSDVTSGLPVPGATVIIKDENGNIVSRSVTDENGVTIITNLPPGKYTFHEEVHPEGYILNTGSFEFIINEDGSVEGFQDFSDEPTELVIKKTDPAGMPLSGAKFQIKDDSGFVYRFRMENGIYIANAQGEYDSVVSDENGMIRVRYLPMRKYKIIEIEAPAGYQLLTSETTAEITSFTGISAPSEVTIVNHLIPPNKPQQPGNPQTPGVPYTNPPLTGDLIPMWVIVGIAILGFGLLSVGVVRKKKQDTSKSEES
ncbi:MAG: SpaA isopeptide-forming pilin-related protein [Fastidiosipilaceae bacterium]|jgi:uncharacterized surface anchored protein